MTYGEEMEAFFKTLRASSVLPEEINGKPREYMPFKQMFGVYQASLGPHALPENALYHRIRKIHTDKVHLVDLRCTEAERGKDAIFINRLNSTLLEEIFTPKGTGIRASSYDKFSDVEEALNLSKELHGWDEDDEE